VASLKAWGKSVAVGIAVGAMCALLLLIAPIRNLEQEVGLPWLFALRGPITPPDDVVMVVMSQRAAANISLPRDPEKFHRCADLVVGSPPPTHVALPSIPSRWPRCLHALLVRKLADAGAEVIAFDVLFRERPPLPGASEDLYAWQDETLAIAIADVDRVVVARKLEFIGGRETLSELSPSISDAALGSAPLPLSADNGRRVDTFVAFKESGQVTPTLPAVAVQAYELGGYPLLASLIARRAGDIAGLLPTTEEHVRANGQLQATCLLIRHAFRANPALARHVLEDLRRSGSEATEHSQGAQVRSLVAMYGGEGDRLLNFYGPSGTIPKVAYDEVLASTPTAMTARFKGRAVFVGYAETEIAEQVEHYPTAVSSGNGLDLSGVEIAATAFGNLLQDSSIRKLPFVYWLVIVFLGGLLTTVTSALLEYRLALAAIVLTLLAYCAAAVYLFADRELWLPLVAPILIAAPVAVLTSFAWKYWTGRREREQLRHAFGYFVPPEVVDRLEHNAGQMAATQELLECACVATDAANFTPLAESMTPEQLSEFLNHYFETLFGRVASHGGFVSDIVGDAMLAIWPNRSPDTHLRVLQALLEMRDAAQQFNEHLAGNRLMTRFGVDWGRVALTTVGAHSHYEYRAVGDTVNTAARIQELNKQLGTRVLLSKPAIGAAADEFLVRDLGHFLLRGKTHPVNVCELLERRSAATAEQRDLCARFEECIVSIRSENHSEALERLRRVGTDFPSDGPTAFYVRMLESGMSWSEGALKVD
jgi:adenylate cyclase